MKRLEALLLAFSPQVSWLSFPLLPSSLPTTDWPSPDSQEAALTTQASQSQKKWDFHSQMEKAIREISVSIKASSFSSDTSRVCLSFSGFDNKHSESQTSLAAWSSLARVCVNLGLKKSHQGGFLWGLLKRSPFLQWARSSKNSDSGRNLIPTKAAGVVPHLSSSKTS